MKFIIHRKTLISMLFIGLTLLGYISYKNLPVELIPNAELPVLIVNVASPLEVDPKYMENEAIIPLEGVVGSLEGIEEIESTATSRRGVIYISFTQKTNIKYAYLRLQERVETIKPTLPEEFYVQVVKIDLEQLSNQFMGLQVRGSGGTDRVRNVVDQDIKPELENVDGIAGVEVFGGRQKSIEIILDEEACKAHGIYPSQVRSLLSQSTKTKTFVGDVIENSRRYFVNVTAEYFDIEDIQNLVVDGRGPILLKDIADIFFGVKEETSYSRVNGKEAVTVQLVRDLQENMIDLSHRTKAVIDQLNRNLRSKDVEIVIQNNMAETMEKNIDLIIRLAVIGGLLAICLLWIFLKNLRLVITVALAIPISVFTAFNFFYAFNISINSLTLVGMALAIGMLLDNSVVVLENIYRIVTGKSDVDKAVIQGTREVWRSIFAATLTTMAVFLPFLFASDFLISLLGKNVGVSIISTLGVSLLVALMLIPMTTHFFIRKRLQIGKLRFRTFSSDNRLVRIYIVLLKACMRYPARTIIGAVFLFFIAVFISLAISISSLQEVDTPEFNLYVTMPGGATLETTNHVVEQIESNVETLEEKGDVISKVYEDEAVVTINLQEGYKKINERTLAQIKRDIQERIEDIQPAEISMDRPTSGYGGAGMPGGGPGGGFERMLGIGSEEEKVVVKGQDFERMRNVAEDVRYFLEGMSSVNSASMSISDNRPEIHISFDQQILSQYGIPLASIVNELNSFQNEFSSGIKFKQGTEEYDIIIKNREDGENREKTMDDLKQLSVRAASGSTYELESLGDIVYATGSSEINRVNQEKHIEVR
ncbi:MAG: efflux RND transporter permease subunit, partial [Bacteroidales bacterium]